MRWDPEWRHEQWWFDAFTVDPAKLVHDLQIVWEAGTPQPVLSCKLENKSVGTTPRVLVYIGVHAKYGTHVWFPYNGARGGGEGEDPKMWQGYQYWFTRLDNKHLEEVHRNSYYNHKRVYDSDQRLKNQKLGDAFDPKLFMVCCLCRVSMWLLHLLCFTSLLLHHLHLIVVCFIQYCHDNKLNKRSASSSHCNTFAITTSA
jgi:hypothetical protein